MDDKNVAQKSGQKKVKICNLSCQAEEVMTKRNEELKKENKIPYTVLLPSRIPAGISIWSLEEKKLLFMRYLLNDERYYAHLVCVLLPSRIPAGISIWSQRWQINRCWKYRFHFVCFSFKFLNIYYRFNLRLKLGQIRSCGCDICQWQTLIDRGALEMQIF